MTAPKPYDLDRFVRAQASHYDCALSELRSGRKQSHWMWFVFPQLEGLGSSSTSRQFAIRSLDEARAYLAHPLLGPRLRVRGCSARVEGRPAAEILGSPDDSLRSRATLFACVSVAGSVFNRLLAKYYEGEQDAHTLRLLAAAGRPGGPTAAESR